MTKQNSMMLQFEANNSTTTAQGYQAPLNWTRVAISQLAKKLSDLMRERLQLKDPECHISPRSRDGESRLVYLSFLNW